MDEPKRDVSNRFKIKPEDAKTRAKDNEETEPDGLNEVSMRPYMTPSTYARLH